MAHAARIRPPSGLRLPPIQPTWTTWVWVAIAVTTFVTVTIALWYATVAFFF